MIHSVQGFPSFGLRAFVLCFGFLVGPLICVHLAQANSIPETTTTINKDLSEKEPPSKFDGTWQLWTGLLGYSEGVNDEFSARFKIKSEGRYRLAPHLDLRGHGEIKINQSRIQTQVEGDESKNRFQLEEFVLDFQPTLYFAIEGGAINQKFLGAQILVKDSAAFPGLKEIFKWDFPSVSFSVITQQTVPTSTSFDDNRIEKEETPKFFTETLLTQVEASDRLKLEGSFTHYRFENLPSVVAYQSRRFGNTAIGGSKGNSQFSYQFDGHLFGSKVLYDFSNCECTYVKAGGYWLRNNKAPKAHNLGQIIYAGGGYQVHSNLLLKVKHTRFFNEYDTSPAYYNHANWGHNNRVGSESQIDFDFLKWGFSLAMVYERSDLINEQAQRDHLEVYQVFLETHHVEF